MSLKVFLLQFWILAVVQSGNTVNAYINCTTLCYSEAQGMDHYCHVECMKTNSQSSGDQTDLHKTKGYSGYAAVAAKIRFQKKQLEEKAKKIVELNKVPNKDDYYLIPTLFLLFIMFCMSVVSQLHGNQTNDMLWEYAYCCNDKGEMVQNEADWGKKLRARLIAEGIPAPETVYRYSFEDDTTF